MRKTFFVIVPCLLMGIGIVGLLVGTKKNATESPLGVLIVKQAMHSKQGIAKPRFSALSIPKRLGSWKVCSPLIASPLTVQWPAGWKAGYWVYFNFPKGRTVRVTVSGNDNGQTWSTGDGDFATEGDFQKLVEQLKSQAP